MRGLTSARVYSQLLAGLLLVCCLAAPAQAEFTCDIDFSYGLVVNKRQLRVMDESRTVLQINDQRDLFIGGRWQQLDNEQQALLREYARGLHYVIPNMIVLANEGVSLAAETIEHVYLGLVGRENESFEKLTSSMTRVKDRVREKFRHASNHYFIGPGSLESVDEFVDTEIEAQLEAAITTSVGGILSAIGGMSTNNTELDSDKVAAITRQLEAMGEQIERDVGPRANTLKTKAKWFCSKLNRLDKVEEKLRQSVPAFKSFNIITSQ